MNGRVNGRLGQDEDADADAPSAAPPPEALPVEIVTGRPLEAMLAMIASMREAGVSDGCILNVLEASVRVQPELRLVFEDAKRAANLRRRFWQTTWFLVGASSVAGAFVGGLITWALMRD